MIDAGQKCLFLAALTDFGFHFPGGGSPFFFSPFVWLDHVSCELELHLQSQEWGHHKSIHLIAYVHIYHK